MDVKIEDAGVLAKKVTITIPADDVQSKMKDAYDKLKREVKLRGFRRGKVPRSIIEKHYKPQVEGEVGEKLVQDTYFEAIEKEKLDPVVHPDIKSAKFNDDGTFTYEAEIELRPDFDLGTYKGLEVEKEDVLVTDEEIQLELEEMRKNLAPLQTVADRAIGTGDVVVVDFQGYHDGEAMPQVKNENFSFEVGSGKMGPEFEEKLVGMTKDEEGSHEVDFPENHPNPLLKGKKVEFKVKVKEIKERILPELDDEFAKDAGEEYNTLEELKNSVRERIAKAREERMESTITDKLMQKLLENHDFQVPKRLVAYEIEQMIKQTEQQFEQAGMSLEAAGLTREKLAEQNEELATKRVRGDFILKKVAEAEEIKLADEDMERGFKRIGDMYNMPVAKVKEFFKNRDDLLPFMNELLNEKILAFLREQAVMVPVAKKEATGAEDTSES